MEVGKIEQLTPRDMTAQEAREWKAAIERAVTLGFTMTHTSMLEQINRLTAERDALIEALEYYACDEKCSVLKMDDGSCLEEAAGGACGKVARDALNRVGRE